MSRLMVRLAVIGAAGLLGLPGCSTGARYVTATNDAAVVAIPYNTNDWPHYYKKQAEDLMQAKFPGGYVIEQQGAWDTKPKRGPQELDATQVLKPSLDNVVNGDHMEWRIYFRRADAQAGTATALATLPPPPAESAVVRTAVGLTPTGSPFIQTPSLNMQNPGMIAPGTRPGITPNPSSFTPTGQQ